MDNSEKIPKEIIRELAEAQKHIQELETYCSLVEGANDGFIIIQDGKIQFINQSLIDLTGLTIDEVLNTPFSKIVHPSVLPTVLERYQQRVAGIPVPSIYETILKLQNEIVVEVEINEKVIDYRGKPADLLIIRDLTKRKKSEEKLSTYHSFIESAPDAFVQFDSKLRLMDINLAGLNRFPDGAIKEDLIGKHMLELFPGIEETDRYSKYLSVIESGEPVFIEEIIANPKFGERYLSVRAFRVNGGLGIISRDVTEHKKINIALVESELKYRTLVEKMEEGVFVEDERGNISFVNPRAIEMVGYTEEEIMGKHWSYFAPEEELEISYIESEKRPKGISSTYESSIQTKNGVTIPVKVSAAPLFTEDGIFNGVLCIFTDISRIRDTLQSLKESEEKHRNLVERANDGITIIQDSIIKFVNPSLTKITGYKAEELLETSFTNYAHPDSLAKLSAINRVSMQAVKEPIILDAILIAKDGTNIDIELNAALIDYRGKPSAYVYVRDITEQKRSDTLLRNVKRKEELYHTMQSHFIKNDLQKIVFALEWNLKNLQFPQEDKRNLNNAIGICHQGAKTIDTVNRIFSVLQSEFEYEKTQNSLLNKIQDVTSKFKMTFGINEKTLDKQILIDKYFSVML
ncbi:MAG: PAS domain-containing protein, partial [Candidatus Hodarchaeales archaeon]